MEPSQMMPKQFRKTRFTAEWLPDDVSFEGWTDGKLWNGWACPLFERDEANRYVELHNKLRAEQHVAPEWVDIMWSDYPYPGVICERGDYEEGSVEEAEGLQDIHYEALTISTPEGPKEVWALGMYSWTWEEVE